MLKRKLYKAGIFCQFLLIVVVRTKAGVPLAEKPLHSYINKSPVIFINDTPDFEAGVFSVKHEPEIIINPSIERFVTDYNERNADMFEKLKLNKSYSLKTIEKIFTSRGLPTELKYLAIVESKLKTTAVSKVGATGMWQIMPATARKLGLKISGKVDERRHAWKSSVAAAKYLDELYQMFDDWLLVIAAYNSGPGYVFNAIKKSGSRDFWKLQYFLPKETRMHVKRFIATHYYFEGEGSIVTLTKKERVKYLASIEEFLALQNENDKQEDPLPNIYRLNWIAVVNEKENLKLIVRK